MRDFGWVFVLLVGCGTVEGNDRPGTDSDADTDADTDTDSVSDTGSESDTDGGSDTGTTSDSSSETKSTAACADAYACAIDCGASEACVEACRTSLDPEERATLDALFACFDGATGAGAPCEAVCSGGDFSSCNACLEEQCQAEWDACGL